MIFCPWLWLAAMLRWTHVVGECNFHLSYLCFLLGMSSVFFFITNKSIFKISSFHEWWKFVLPHQRCSLFFKFLFCVAKSEQISLELAHCLCDFLEQQRHLQPSFLLLPWLAFNSYPLLQHNRFPVYGFCISSGMELGRAVFVNVAHISQKLKGRNKLAS